MYIYIYIFIKVGNRYSFKNVWLKTVAILVLANFFSMPLICLWCTTDCVRNVLYFFSLINCEKMNFGNLLFLQPDNIKKSLRNIEGIEKKLANTRIATVFNQTCVLKWIYIYIYIICMVKKYAILSWYNLLFLGFQSF